ncbi:TPA: hypothetical protein ACGBJW_005179, partial [Escherichia coli]
NKIRGCKGNITFKKERETITDECKKTPSKPNLQRYKNDINQKLKYNKPNSKSQKLILKRGKKLIK